MAGNVAGLLRFGQRLATSARCPLPASTCLFAGPYFLTHFPPSQTRPGLQAMGVWTHPSSESQVSAVHASSSSQSAFSVQQSSPMGAWMHSSVPGSQLSTVQVLSSSQSESLEHGTPPSDESASAAASTAASTMPDASLIPSLASPLSMQAETINAHTVTTATTLNRIRQSTVRDAVSISGFEANFQMERSLAVCRRPIHSSTRT